MMEILNTIEDLGIHRGGWIVVSVLLLVPAIVSVNMIQFYLTKVFQRKLSWSAAAKPLLGNLLIAFVSIAVMGTTLILYR